MNALCAADPVGDACRTAVNTATQYIAMQDAWALLNGDVTRSSKNTFEYVYNSLGAESRFALYYNTIDNQADFFGASDRYKQNIGSGAKWYGGAEFVSRAPLTGLGADGSGSGYTFLLGSALAGINADTIYDWRAEAGNALMSAGFRNFSTLYNEGGDPVRWDINQLISEQQTLQPIHEKYLKDRAVFRFISGHLTDTDFSLGAGNNFVTSDRQGQPRGIDILDYQSRVRYGCRLLGYSKQQGCTP